MIKRRKKTKLSGRQQARIKQNSRSPHERIIYHAQGSKISRRKIPPKKRKAQEKEAREGRGGADGRMGERTKEREEKNERTKTRETMGASGNKKKSRKRLLDISAE